MTKAFTFTLGNTASKPLSVDLLKLIDTRLLVQANSGGGKSWLLRLIAERVAGHVQLIILDPEGEFATLREKLELALVDGGAELSTDVRTAALLARKLVEFNISAIVDLYELRLPERREYVRLFLESLMNVPRAHWHPVIIMIDEAHLFCPERSAGEAESTQAVIALMSQGRKRGFCGVLSTQRLSKLHKDAAAESNNVVIGRTWLDVDQQRAGDLLGMDKTGRQALRDLDPGEFYAFGPAFSANGVVQFHSDKVATSHPKAGQRHEVTAPPASASIQELVKQLGDIPKAAAEEARSIDELRAENAKLKRELHARPVQMQMAPAAPPKIERVEVPVITDAQIQRLEAALAEMNGMVERYLKVNDLGKTLIDAERALSQAIKQARQPAPAGRSVPAPQARPAIAPRPAAAQPARSSPRAGDDKLTGGELKIMALVAQYPEGVTREQITVTTGYKRSSRDTYLQRLSSRGLVNTNREGKLVATAEGIQTLGEDYEPLPTGSALQEYWKKRLSGGELAILKVAIAAHPEAIDREAISEQTEYKRSSRDTYIQRLQSRRLVTTERGAIRASDMLFD